MLLRLPRYRCSFMTPSGDGSIEQRTPPDRTPSIARKAVIRSSSWSSGRPLAAATTLPAGSITAASAGPARITSCPSGSTNTWVIRSRPPRKTTSAGSGLPVDENSSIALHSRASDTFRSAAGLPPTPAPCASNSRRRAANSCEASGSSVRTMPWASTEMPPTAWPPKPMPIWATAGAAAATTSRMAETMVAAVCPPPNRRRETRPARDELAIVIGNLESATNSGS